MNGLHHIAMAFAVLASAAPLQASVNRRTPIVEAVERALPAVVNIGTERRVKTIYADPFLQSRDDAMDRLFREFLGAPPPQRYRNVQSLGSGVVIAPSGYILTNFHVVDRAAKIRVQFSDDEVYEALFLAGDPVSDLALIKIDPRRPLPSIRLAANDDLLLGETLIALGNPFGLTHTVTVGVLSAMNREARYEGEVVYRDILQTDAAVNPGNSGGPLINVEGDLVGINVAVYQRAQNISFAVPVRRARALLERWLSPRMLHKSWLGFDPAVAEGRLVVGEVDAESPAGAAGLTTGEPILALNGQPVADVFEFNRAMLVYNQGDDVRVTLAGASGEREVELPLVMVPKPNGEKLARERLGLLFTAQTPEAAVKVGYPKGLGIQGVLAGGPAEAARLRTGLLVSSVNEVEIRNLDDVGVALENVLPGDRVTLRLVRLVEQQAFVIAQTSFVELTAR